MQICRAILILLCTWTSVAISAPPASNKDHRVFKVGSEFDFYPYAYVDKNGEAAGFSVDLINAVADTMGLKIQIIAEPWDKIWNDLVAGRIDILPLVGKLPERANLIEFSMPHTGTSDGFFTRKSDPPLTHVADAKGKSIVVMKSDVAHHKLLEFKFEGTIVPVTTITEGLELIAKGEHDAFLGPLLMANLAIKENRIEGIRANEPVPEYIRIQAFAVKKGDFELLAKLNQGLEIIKSNGEYNRIYDRWLSNAIAGDSTWNGERIGFAVAVALVLILIAVYFRRTSRKLGI
jgi:ABC-type amino acid transport substrate-binding protein